MNIIPLSRVDIYEFFGDTSLIDEVNEEISKTPIQWTPTSARDQNSDSKKFSNTSIGYLNDNIPYYNYKLFNWIQGCVDSVAELHYDKKLAIVDSWLTKNEFGQTTEHHHHISSVISGLLYLTAFKNSGTIFTYPDPWTAHLPNLIMPNYKKIKIYPEKGKLILWRSDIKHAVQPHTDLKTVRHTLAFNTFFDGVLNNNVTGRLSLKVESVKDKYEAYMNKKNNETM